MKTITKLSIFSLLLFISNFSFAQEEIVLQTARDTVQTNDSDEVFVFIENPPVFQGGDEARIKYLSENIHYPEKAKANRIQGVVYVTFIVEKDGSISNVEVLRGIGGGCDEEAVRVISNMPDWSPGTQRGKAVRTQFNMPIRFVLAGGEKPLSKKELKALRKKQKREAKEKRKSDKDLQRVEVNEKPIL